MKRIVSFFLIFSLLVGLFSFSAFALTDEEHEAIDDVFLDLLEAGSYVVYGKEKTGVAMKVLRALEKFGDVLWGYDSVGNSVDASSSSDFLDTSSDPYSKAASIGLRFACLTSDFFNSNSFYGYLPVERSVLDSFVLDLQMSGIHCDTMRYSDKYFGDYWYVRLPNSVVLDRGCNASHLDHKHFLTTPFGYLLCSPVASNDSMISNDGRNYYITEGDKITNEGDTTHIYNGGDTYNDNSDHSTTNNVYNYETNEIYDYTNGQWYDVENLYYDASTKTYTANYRVHNGDVYYDYSMHWTYNIDYTSITYIGSSETYDIYNIYYELPDGRSSSDLTAEDLEQLNLEYDVINYGQSCDDTSLRALYHFDGDTQDSSYWSSYSNFDWIKGASITYLEANEGFEGCLYLDETLHQFSITLPSALSYSDFSILFRYYQMESLNTEEVSFSARAGESLCSLKYSLLPAGTWMEIGLIRSNGRLWIYVNGIPIAGGGKNNFVYSDTVRFTLPEAVQAVRYFDELRVFNKAIVEDGKDYTPIIHAQTTNNVLVLPGEAKPIPDEYWTFNPDGNILPVYDFLNDYENLDLSSYSSLSAHEHVTEFQLFYPADKPQFYESGMAVSGGFSCNPCFRDPEGWFFEDNGYLLPLSITHNEYYGDSFSYCLPEYIPFQTYTFTVLFNDGTSSSLTFSDTSFSSVFDNCKLTFYRLFAYSSDFNSTGLWLQFSCPDGADIVYWELVPGSKPNSGHEKVTVVYDPLDLDGPTIAIRSQIPVNNWKIGGVRPTVPVRGDVWCGIQSSSIYTSQIYNGFAWVECEIRIWTDKERWVSAGYYNVLTQQDFYDISGTTDIEHLQTSQGFYSWFQTQWKQLIEILQTIDKRIENLALSSSGGVDLNFTIDGGIDVTFTKLAEDGRSGVLRVVYTFWELIFVDVFDTADSVLDDLSSAYGRGQATFKTDDGSGWTVWAILMPTGDDLWEIPEEVFVNEHALP